MLLKLQALENILYPILKIVFIVFEQSADETDELHSKMYGLLH